MTNLETAFSELKLGTNAQIDVALNQLKESDQTTSFVYVDLAKTKVEKAWTFIEELLITVAESQQVALDAESKIETLSVDFRKLENRNNELEAEVTELKEQLSLANKSRTLLTDELSEVKQDLAEVTLERNREQGKAAQLQGQINKLSNIEKELSDLKALNPHQLKVERDQATNKFTKEKINHNATKSKLNNQILDLQHEVSALNNKLVAIAGQKQHQSIMGTDKKTRFHVREYQGSNELRLEFDPSLGTVDDLDWHIKVEAGNGICLHMGVSDFFTPLMPYCAEIDKLYPVALNDYLHKFLMEKLKETHPRHIRLIKAAKKEVLTTKTELFSEQEVKWLQKARLITLYDACSLTFGTFGTKIKNASGKSYDCALMNDLYKKVQNLALILKQEHKFKC